VRLFFRSEPRLGKGAPASRSHPIMPRKLAWLRTLLFVHLAAVIALLGGTAAHAGLPAPIPVAASADGGWEWSGTGTTMYATPDEACLRQFQRYNPNGTYFPPVRESARTYQCKWTGSIVLSGYVRFACRNGSSYYQPGQCLPPTKPAKILIEQCCQADGRGVSASPSPSTAHPVSIATGTKTWAEEDYASEDGLLTVSRKYRSRLRGGERISFKEPDRFGSHWQGTLPGPLVFGTSTDSEVELLDERGGLYAFVSTTDPANTSFTANTFLGSEHRLKLEIAASIPVGMGRKDFIETAAVSAPGVAEFRVERPNGDYILYRRPTAAANNVGVRTAVPIEQGQASGYKQFFDYNGDSPVPYRLRDSFGRQIGFEWALTNDLPGRFGVSERAIQKLTLPDGSYLEYGYDDGVGSPNPLGQASTTYTGAGGPGAGNVINWTSGATVYSKTRLRTVTRKSAAGAALWSRKYLYENAQFRFALSGIEDHLGRRLTTYTYDANGDVASTESAGGVDRHEFTNSYTSATRMRRTVKGPLGHIATYEFEIPATIKRYSAANLLSVKGDANGSVVADEQTYSYAGNLIGSLTDRRGTVTSFANDTAFGRPTLVKDAAGNALEQQTSVTWHPKWDLPVVQQLDGLRIETVYDAQGRVTARTATDTTTHSLPYVTAGQSRTTGYSWTAQGRLAQINGPLAPDALGHDDITSFAYDASGNLASVTNALGHLTAYAGHDANGRAATMTDANGVVTAFVYDPLGRMTSVTVKHPTTPALDAVTALEYDAEGRVTGITLPQTAKLLVDYSAIGRVTALRADDGERIDFTYDPMGNVVARTVKRSNGAVTQTMAQSFDALGRLLTVTLGAGRPRSFAYDKDDNITGITDPRNFTSTKGFDALGRLVSTTNPDGGVESAGFNKRDEVVSYKDPINVTTSFLRDGFGEVIQEVSPDRGTSLYYYDAGGRMSAAIDGRGQRIDYGYDTLGRMLTKTPVGRPASETILYAYDGIGIGGGLGSYQLGRLTGMSDGTGLTRYAYDPRGNLIARQQSLAATTATLSYAYDLADRITQMVYPSGRAVRYNYDSKGRVSGVDTRSAPTTAWVALINAATYQPFGAVETMSLGNGLVAANDRALDGRLKARRLTNATTNTALANLAYVYDPDGNVSAIDDAVTPDRSAIYGYDPMGRLNLTAADGSASAATYSYTAGTNRLASLTTPVGTRTIQYDARGNPASESRPAAQSVSLGYDGHGRLTSYDRSSEAMPITAWTNAHRPPRPSAATPTRAIISTPLMAA
jgi:YD repeat-containing protein